MKEKAIPLCNFTWCSPPKLSRKTDKVFKFKHVTISEVVKLLRKLKRKKEN